MTEVDKNSTEVPKGVTHPRTRCKTEEERRRRKRESQERYRRKMGQKPRKKFSSDEERDQNNKAVNKSWHERAWNDEEYRQKRLEYQREWYKNRSEEQKERDRISSRRSYNKTKDLDRTQESVLKSLVRDARKRAKRKGLDFDLDWKLLTIPKDCPVLGITLQINQKNKTFNPTSPSLDRFDNSKGYTKDNVRVISLRANTLKNDASLDEIKLILKYMEEG